MHSIRLHVIFATAIVLAACQPSAPTSSSAPDAKAAATTASAPASAAPAAVATATAVTGIAVCDDYLNKYEACLRDKLPEATRSQFQSGLDAMRNSWTQLAANPQTASTLENACMQAKSSAAVAMQAYGCTF